MSGLLDGDLRVVTAGAAMFADTLSAQGVAVEQVEWRPPADGDADLADCSRGPGGTTSTRPTGRHCSTSSTRSRCWSTCGQPVRSSRVWQRDTVLHAGPPIAWERLSDPVRAAAVGALLHEGLAPDAETAERMARAARCGSNRVTITRRLDRWRA